MDDGADPSPVPTREAWWKSHFSAASVLIVAALTAMLYFLGSRRLEAIAEQFGMAGTPRTMGLQEVMMAGMAAVEGVVLLGLSIVWLGIGILIFGLMKLLDHTQERGRQVAAEGDALQAEVEALAAMDESEMSDAQVLALEVRGARLSEQVRGLERLTKASRFSVRAIYGFAWVLAGGSMVLFMNAGALSGRLEARMVMDEVRGTCSGCFRYVTGDRTVIARPIFQADEFIAGYSKDGTVIIPLDPKLRVTRYEAPKADSKKAGPREETRKPVGALKPASAPASSPAGSPSA